MNLSRYLLIFKFMHKYINGCAAAVMVHIILMFEQLTVHIDDVQGLLWVLFIFPYHIKKYNIEQDGCNFSIWSHAMRTQRNVVI